MRNFILGNVFIFILISRTAIAQTLILPDPIFTQTMTSPMYFNPAYAGFQENLRASFQIRAQLLAGTTNLTTDASVDIGLPKINSGVGLMLMSDQQDNSSLITNTISAFYAYELKLGSESYLRLGLEASLFQKLYIYNNSTFDTSASSATRFYPQNMSTYGIPNFGAGGLYYNDRYYLGLGIYNVFTPNASFNNDPDGDLKRRFVAQAGEFVNIGNLIINPSLQIINQGSVSQILPGCAVTAGSFTFGMSLRQSIPVFDALNILLGFGKGKLRICYSYDITLSATNPGAASGTHELSAIVQLASPHDVSNKKMVGYMKEAL